MQEVEVKADTVLEYFAMASDTHRRLLDSLESSIITTQNMQGKLDANTAMKEYVQWLVAHPAVISMLCLSWTSQAEELRSQLCNLK